MTTSPNRTIRAFIAVRPGEAVRAELIRVQRELKKALAHSGLRIKWIDPDTFHITLLFLGNIPADRIDGTLQCLEKTAQSFPGFGTVLNEPGVFKKSGAVWVGLDVPPALFELQKALASGLEMEPAHFHAHFTLGRIKTGRPDKTFFQALEKIDVEPVPFEIDSIELVQSELRTEGARHTVRGIAPLAK